MRVTAVLVAASLLLLLTASAEAGPAAGQAVPKKPIELKGQPLFVRYCTGCHGAQGRGDGPAAHLLTPPPADLTSLTYKHGDEDRQIRKVIAEGIPKTDMAPWNGTFRPDQIDDLVTYLQWLRHSQP